MSEESQGGGKVGGAPLGRALHPCRRLATLLTWTPSPLGVFWSKKIIVKFYSVWTPFSIPFLQSLKTRKKIETGTGV